MIENNERLLAFAAEIAGETLMLTNPNAHRAMAHAIRTSGVATTDRGAVGALAWKERKRLQKIRRSRNVSVPDNPDGQGLAT
jgi:multisubunit Na+/H+ antiporter MnhG subunit